MESETTSWWQEIGPGARVAWAAVAFMLFVTVMSVTAPARPTGTEPVKRTVYGTLQCYDSAGGNGQRVLICDPPLPADRRPY